LILFPELANSGYIIGRESKDFPSFATKYCNIAEKIPGPYTEAIGEAAKKHGVHVAIGLSEAHPSIPGTLFNSSTLIGPSGEILGIYRKAHIPGEEKHFFYAGNGVEVFHSELGNIGLMICADSSFPEFARVLSLKGAEILCISFCRPKKVLIGGDPQFAYTLVSCRGFENNIFVVACDRVGKEGDNEFLGRSCICGPQGEFLARSEVETEDILVADLHADDLKAARIRWSRFRDRRPDLYGIICQS